MMPEKVILSRQIIKVFSLLCLFTFIMSLAVIIYTWLNIGSNSELLQLAGADFLVSRALVVAITSLVLGLGGLKVCSGIATSQRWSWYAALPISFILILLFPLGTLFGIKLLINLFSAEVKSWFRETYVPPRQPLGRPTPGGGGLNRDLIRQLEEARRKK